MRTSSFLVVIGLVTLLAGCANGGSFAVAGRDGKAALMIAASDRGPAYAMPVHNHNTGYEYRVPSRDWLEGRYEHRRPPSGSCKDLLNWVRATHPSGWGIHEDRGYDREYGRGGYGERKTAIVVTDHGRAVCRVIVVHRINNRSTRYQSNPLYR
jgi:hypothetical protein